MTVTAHLIHAEEQLAGVIEGLSETQSCVHIILAVVVISVDSTEVIFLQNREEAHRRASIGIRREECGSETSSKQQLSQETFRKVEHSGSQAHFEYDPETAVALLSDTTCSQ